MTLYGNEEQCKKFPGFYQKLPKEYEELLKIEKDIKNLYGRLETNLD
jgi:hypothetical protein